MTATILDHPADTTTPAHAPARDRLSPTALATLHLLRLGGPAAPRAIAATLDVTVPDVIGALAPLLERGLVRAAGGDHLQIAAI